MLYFRFDNKDGFKGAEHTSGFVNWYDICLDKFQETKEYDELDNKFEWGSDEYQKALDEAVIGLAFEKGLLLNGCSCFELTEEGIEEYTSYIKTHPINDYEEFNVFEGINNGLGHDGERVAKCTNIVYTGKTKDFMNIINDENIENKLEEILKLINK